MGLKSLPEIVERLEDLTYFIPKRHQVKPGLELIRNRGFLRPGHQLARKGVAMLIVGEPKSALNLVLHAMSQDSRWWDLAVEIGQWCDGDSDG